MRSLGIGIIACISVLAPQFALMAQMPKDELALLLRSVVRVEANGLSGSGLVVGEIGNRLTVITAGHVVGGPTAATVSARVAQTADGVYARRKCRYVPEISYKFEKAGTRTAVNADCSVALDLAVIEVDVPPEDLRAIISFAQSVAVVDTEDLVNLVGIPQGVNWSRISNAKLTIKPPARQDDSAVDRNDLFEINAAGVQSGYSGGAVLDREAGLIGMIVSAADPTVYALPWRNITKLLSEWGVQANRLASRSGGGNPAFLLPSAPTEAEGARNAIRRYQSAFANKRIDVLLDVYPAIRRSVHDLFGDSVRNELDLADCTDMVDAPEEIASKLRAKGQDANDGKLPIFSLSCEFRLAIFRRTGPPFSTQSWNFGRKSKQPPEPPIPCDKAPDGAIPCMTFYLEYARRDAMWRIIAIEPIEDNAK